MIRAPYQAHSATSEAAASSLAPVLGELHARVWAAVMASDAGLTDEEICERTGLQGNTVRPRRVELVATGHLVEGGKRPTKNGRNAVVWACPDQVPVRRVSPSDARPSAMASLPEADGAPTDSGSFSADEALGALALLVRR